MTTCPTDRPTDNKSAPTPDRVIELVNVGKSYPLIKNSAYANTGIYALKGISLCVDKGAVLGIIGRNGAGKTTLLNIMSGSLSPSEGSIVSQGRIAGLFNLGVGFQNVLSGRENIFLNGTILGSNRKELEERLADIIEFSELGEFINMPLGTYSQGMRLRLGFSIIANLDFDILLIDEVLAVGDALFQNKCFRRLTEFRRQGRTLVITAQSMDLIERLCDRLVVLDHGRLVFDGNVRDGINKYLALLNNEKFFVGPEEKRISLVENTKRWAADVSGWGRKLGTKEAKILRVIFKNRFGLECKMIKSNDALIMRADFTAIDRIKDPHFGVGIFRNDGVYCYGPNTFFDGYVIPEVKPGKGFFEIRFKHLYLAPGKYKVSVAVWDRNEKIAFDYHDGCYDLIVEGKPNGGLVNMPFCSGRFRYFPFRARLIERLTLSLPDNNGARRFEDSLVKIDSICLRNSNGEEKTKFFTNERVGLKVKFSELTCPDRKTYLWLGLYRSDGIYCQGIVLPLGKDKSYKLNFPQLSLLPGGYSISLGVWDSKKERFLAYCPAIFHFQTIFDRQDHGTIYLEHMWRWRHA